MCVLSFQCDSESEDDKVSTVLSLLVACGCVAPPSQCHCVAISKVTYRPIRIVNPPGLISPRASSEDSTLALSLCASNLFACPAIFRTRTLRCRALAKFPIVVVGFLNQTARWLRKIYSM